MQKLVNILTTFVVPQRYKLWLRRHPKTTLVMSVLSLIHFTYMEVKLWKNIMDKPVNVSFGQRIENPMARVYEDNAMFIDAMNNNKKES